MTTNFSVSRDDIINAALRSVGVLGLTQSPQANDLQFATMSLNLMLKNWQAKGVTLWKIKEVVLAMQANITQYPIGPTAGFVLSIPVTAGGSGYDNTSTLTLSAPGTFSGWTNVTATATPNISGGVVTGVTITNPGTGYLAPPTIVQGGAGAGATFDTPVMVGTTVQRPLRVLDQGNFIRRLATHLDTPIIMIARDEYETYGSKTSTGVPNSFFYDPQIAGGNGILSVYPAPVDTSTELHLFCQSTIEDVNNPTDTFDFPQEWYMALRYGLAREIMIEYGVDADTERRIERRWAECSTELLSFSVEEASTYFQYDTRGR